MSFIFSRKILIVILSKRIIKFQLRIYVIKTAAVLLWTERDGSWMKCILYYFIHIW